ncbi:hypothetical protein NDU88_006777 [Pleurodeles waltl]|uniref:Uncharacterized protein n=1 Tax=Pleurodeles waltl TaxID=8319 RepID=A0AAV7M129_PLEWA|nr:hypothetical protein NDU88_006777 [Pleurodeles waltl]
MVDYTQQHCCGVFNVGNMTHQKRKLCQDVVQSSVLFPGQREGEVEFKEERRTEDYSVLDNLELFTDWIVDY